MVADDVRRALEGDGPVLDPILAAVVATVGWRRLAAVGIDCSSYSTARALAGDPTARRTAAALLPIETRDDPIQVETFQDSVPSRYAELGIRGSGLGPARLQAALGAGLRTLGRSAEALAAVAALVRSIHPMHVADPAYDVSYSDPEVPFSIFIGIHEEAVEHEHLRLAEAILHEAMHLQLSLAEDVVPLVAGAQERWSSPWQRRPRPAQGVLHGLYVFRGIHEFLSARLDAEPQGPDASYIRRRMQDIDGEIADAGGVVASHDLTAPGRALVRRLVGPRAQ